MKPELLAPAGSYEALKIALAAGADAVYLGGSKFGARAYADNLDERTLCHAIDEVHLQEKKIYLTVNTLLKEQELEKELYSYLLPYYRQGLDAVIVQDYGVLCCIRRWFPDLAIHCSTQMAVTGPLGARFLEKQGVRRIVTARELSLQEISSIHRETHLEIESFVHGALCYCYSGQCLFSSMIGGRSGNRGRCAQPCRLPYQVSEREKILNGRQNAYALSPKDMCTVELLPQILGAGVRSLKIEGRMKKPEYTAGVVGIYRKYLDLLLENPEHYQVEQKDLQDLSAIYNRDGFNRSYYQVRNGKNMMAFQNRKNDGAKQALRESQMRETIYEQIRGRYSDKKMQEKIKGSFTIYSDLPAILTLYAGDVVVTVEKEGVQTARNQPLSRERIERQLKKTGDAPFEFESLEIFAGEDVFVPMQFLNEMRRAAMMQLEQELVRRFWRSAPKIRDFEETQEMPASEKSWEEPKEFPVLTASVETREQLAALLKIGEISGFYLGYEIFEPKLFAKQAPELTAQLLRLGKKVFLAFPHVVRSGELSAAEPYLESLIRQGLSGFLVRNLETFAMLKEHGLESYAVLDQNLYTMNRQAQRFWEEQGTAADTPSLELNDRELGERQNSRSEMVIYGYAPMMISAQCLKKNFDSCVKEHSRLSLKDRYGKNFTVQCCCNTCYNVIYNSVPMVLLREAPQIKKLGMKSLRLVFTIEDPKTAADTARAYISGYLYDLPVSLEAESTRGHYKRGVE